MKMKNGFLVFVFGIMLFSAIAITETGKSALDDKNPSWKGSIKVEGVKVAVLVERASFPIQRAMAIALRHTKGGMIWKAEMEVENGYLVYSIQVITSKKQAMEIVIDAGNSAILAVEPGDVEELGTGEKE